MEKKAIHFGGGNIGRGFVAELLYTAGYEVAFIDVMDSIINALQNTESYEVTEVSDEGEVTKTITTFMPSMLAGHRIRFGLAGPYNILQTRAPGQQQDA